MDAETEKKSLRYTFSALGLTALVGGVMFYYDQEIYYSGKTAWTEVNNFMKPSHKSHCFSTTIKVVEIEAWPDSPFERQKMIDREVYTSNGVLFDPVEEKYRLSSLPAWRFKEKGRINYCP